MGRTATEWVLNLVDNITAPLRAVDGACRSTSAAADTITDSIEDIHQSAGRMPGTAERIGAAAFVFNQVTDAVGRLNGEIKNATAGQLGFETALAKANTMAGVGTGELKGVEDQIRAISTTMPTLRNELANGFYQVVSNSVPKENWMGFLEATAKASVGGVADLGQAVKVTSTIVKNYGLEWNQAGLIQDKIQKTANLGVTSFGELGEALPRVAGSAKTLGVNLDELLGSYATLTGVSGNTAEVSTQLGAIFTALVKPSTEASKAAEAMGLQFDAAAIQAAGGMQNYFNQVQSKVEAYSARTGELSTEIYGKLFGSAEALRAFLPLTGEIGEVWKEKTGEVVNAAGTIEEAFSQMANTTEARTQTLRNKISNFTDGIVSAVSGCLPFITVCGDAVTSASSFGFAVYGLSAILKKDLWVSLLNAGKGIAGFIVRCGAGAVSAGTFALASVSSFTAFKLSAITACRVVGTAIMSIPIVGWIAAIIAGIVALVAWMYNSSAETRGILFGVWEFIKVAFVGYYEFIREVMQAIWQSIKDVFNPANWFRDSTEPTAFDKIVQAAANYGEKIGSAYSNGKQKGMENFTRADAAEREESGGAGGFIVPADLAGGSAIKITQPVGIVAGGTDGGTGNTAVNLAGIGGGSGSGRNVSMNVTFNQHFQASPGGNVNGLAEQVLQVITGVLRDATVATT